MGNGKKGRKKNGKGFEILHDVIVDDELKKYDLHLHSRYSSDSVMSYDDIIEIVKHFRKKVISFTDHDSIGNPEEMKALSGTYGITIIPGIEISSRIESTNTRCHILGYDFDPSAPEFSSLVEDMVHVRIEAVLSVIKNIQYTHNWVFPDNIDIEKMVRERPIHEVLKKVYFHVAFHNFKDFIYSDYDSGYLWAVIYDKYSRIISALAHFDARRVLSAILNSGGIPVLAHPTSLKISKRDIEELVDMGLKGIEVFHRMLKENEVEQLLYECRRKGLGITVGSDFHGKRIKDLKSIKLTRSEEKNIFNLFKPPVERISDISEMGNLGVSDANSDHDEEQWDVKELEELQFKVRNYVSYLKTFEKQNRMINKAKQFTDKWRNGNNGYINHKKKKIKR